MVIPAYMVFMSVSCGSPTQKADDHGHEHTTETHNHDHDQEHSGQETFTVGDTTEVPVAEEQHDHDHEPGHEH